MSCINDLIGGKSSVLLDIKPWDDETDMKKLEKCVRSIQLPGLLWGALKLVSVGYGTMSTRQSLKRSSSACARNL